MSETKICCKCKKEMPATNEYFGRNGTGLRGRCKKCRTEDAQINKEQIKEQKSKYYKNYKDKVTKDHKEYKKTHAEEIKLMDKNYRDTHKEEAKIYKEQYRKEHKEYLQAVASDYYEKNKRTMYIKDKQRLKLNIISSRLYYNIYSHKRRAIAKQLPSNFTIKQWKECKESFNSCCAYCGKPMKRLEQDHFIPLTKQGDYTKNNIIPACRHCNASKSNKYFEDWYIKQEFYSIEREKRILQFLGYKKNIQQLSISI
jgi:hypothetical protein